MATFNTEINGHEVCIYKPQHRFDTVLYWNISDDEEIDEFLSHFEKQEFALVTIRCNDWNAELSPWKAPTAYKGGEDFAGKADEHLKMLLGDVIPYVEKCIGKHDFNGIIGYSLAGLFSIYSFYSCGDFELCGCVSGSLWYDGFADWISDKMPLAETGSVYFSLGDKEEAGRNPRFKGNSKCMKEIAAKLNDTEDYEAKFTFNEGNHFVNATARMVSCVKWLLGED